MSDATLPVVIGTIIICVLKLGLFLIDKYYPPIGAEISSIVDSITNLHQKVDQIMPPPAPKASSAIPLIIDKI